MLTLKFYPELKMCIFPMIANEENCILNSHSNVYLAHLLWLLLTDDRASKRIKKEGGPNSKAVTSVM